MSHFAVRGVVEGFYGSYYTFEQRDDLIAFIASCGFNRYYYAPKKDPYHRDGWREAYPPAIMESFLHTTKLARKAGVEFCYMISPITIEYSASQDFECLIAKLLSFYEIGVRYFGILFDDISHELTHASDRQQFASYASAHASVCNRVYQWLKSIDAETSLILCPTDYYGSAPFSAYQTVLGDELEGAIEVFYTGKDICSEHITFEDVAAFGRVIQRPPILWDNYPVNDLAMRRELHIGPLEFRDATLGDITHGYVSNLMLEPEASKIPLVTIGDYLQHPEIYTPQQSFAKAISRVAGPKALSAMTSLAENIRRSILHPAVEETLWTLVKEAMSALKNDPNGIDSGSRTALAHYLNNQRESAYWLANLMDNDALRIDVLPWIERIEIEEQIVRYAFFVLDAAASGRPDPKHALKSMNEAIKALHQHPKYVANDTMDTLIDQVRDTTQEVKG